MVWFVGEHWDVAVNDSCKFLNKS